MDRPGGKAAGLVSTNPGQLSGARNFIDILLYQQTEGELQIIWWHLWKCRIL